MNDKDDNKKSSGEMVPNEIEQLTKAIETYSSSWLDGVAKEDREEFSLETDVEKLAEITALQNSSDATTHKDPESILAPQGFSEATPVEGTKDPKLAALERSAREAKRVEELAEELASKDRLNGPRKHQEFMSEQEARDRAARSKDRVLIPTVHKEVPEKKGKKKQESNKVTSKNSLIPRVAKGKDSFSKKKNGSLMATVARLAFGASYLALIGGAIYGHGYEAMDKAHGKVVQTLALYDIQIPDPRDYEFKNPFDESSNGEGDQNKALPAVIFSDPVTLDRPEDNEPQADATASQGSPQADATASQGSPQEITHESVVVTVSTAPGDIGQLNAPDEATERSTVPSATKQPITPIDIRDQGKTGKNTEPIARETKVESEPPKLFCRTWENLNADSSELLASSLNKMRVKYSRQEKDQPKFYVVAIDPFSAPQGYVANLASKGVKETFRIKEEGPLKDFVSLGQFKFRSSAVQHKENLEQQGIEFLTIAGHKINKLTTFKAKLSPSEFSTLPTGLKRTSSQNC
ncbi:hypothetical protein CL689_03720 [Candidatus Saccharibacteria bacterium]|nr:hypothetical protein [Candidatus Saccharibacteria bacterium]